MGVSLLFQEVNYDEMLVLSRRAFFGMFLRHMLPQMIHLKSLVRIVSLLVSLATVLVAESDRAWLPPVWSRGAMVSRALHADTLAPLKHD